MKKKKTDNKAQYPGMGKNKLSPKFEDKFKNIDFGNLRKFKKELSMKNYSKHVYCK